jgi:hypothetical protein
MPTVKTVKPTGGGDFTSLDAWERWASTQATADQWAECYGGGNLGKVHLRSWTATPSPSLYPKIYAATGQQHTGDDSAGCYISVADDHCINNELRYLRVEGIRVRHGAADTYYGLYSIAGNVQVTRCFFIGSNSSAYSSAIVFFANGVALTGFNIENTWIVHYGTSAAYCPSCDPGENCEGSRTIHMVVEGTDSGTYDGETDLVRPNPFRIGTPSCSWRGDIGSVFAIDCINNETWRAVLDSGEFGIITWEADATGASLPVDVSWTMVGNTLDGSTPNLTTYAVSGPADWASDAIQLVIDSDGASAECSGTIKHVTVAGLSSSSVGAPYDGRGINHCLNFREAGSSPTTQSWNWTINGVYLGLDSNGVTITGDTTNVFCNYCVFSDVPSISNTPVSSIDNVGPRNIFLDPKGGDWTAGWGTRIRNLVPSGSSNSTDGLGNSRRVSTVNSFCGAEEPQSDDGYGLLASFWDDYDVQSHGGVPNGTFPTGSATTSNVYDGAAYYEKNTNFGEQFPHPPAPGIADNDQYAVRWTGYITPRHTEVITLDTSSDDGHRVYINNVLVIDRWITDANNDGTYSFNAIGNTDYQIKIEYFEDTGGEYFRMQWSGASFQEKEVIPLSRLSRSGLFLAPESGGVGDFFHVFP